MRVRRLDARDRDAWDRLFRAYIVFYRAQVSDEVIDLTWQRLLAGGEADPMMGLMAVDDADVPFGLAHVLFHRATWSASWYCYLEDLFVDQAARKTGAGRALIEAVYREADARGCTPHLLGDRGSQRHRPRALRPRRHQGSVRAVPAIGVRPLRI